MIAQELSLEKVLEVAPELKDYKLNSVFFVSGELNTVSGSSVPFKLMKLAESKILKAAKDGYFCDATECECTGICTFMKSHDDDECHDDELNIEEMLNDKNIFTKYNHTNGVSLVNV